MMALPLASQTAAIPDALRRTQLFRHHGTVVWSCGSGDVKAFIYESGLAVDADGAFRAYHPNNRLGLDSIDHAGRPGNWWALETDTGKPSGQPVLQGKDDPAPGYYVSMTSLFDSNIPNEHNPRRFIDAASIPYVVLSPKGFKHAQLGDFATIINLRRRQVVRGHRCG
jgi:outer membrane protein assembly factor BamB